MVAEDHMKCLELLGILISFMEEGERILTAALQHLSALPVPLLRQVYVQGSKMMFFVAMFRPLQEPPEALNARLDVL